MIDLDLAAFRDRFQRRSDMVQLVALVSPT